MSIKKTPVIDRELEKKEARIVYQHCIDLIVALRHLCNFTQEVASYELDIERSELTKYENGNIHIPMRRFYEFCHIYYHYIECHHIELSEKVIKLEEYCRPFGQKKIYL